MYPHKYINCGISEIVLYCTVVIDNTKQPRHCTVVQWQDFIALYCRTALYPIAASGLGDGITFIISSAICE